jgi:2-polyprenyl-6-methoxyphenol hydroxylase-like FAD-dependent oxidoreductase
LAQPNAHVLVVGAGIAGLCCGLALSRIGVDVEIIERVNEMKEVGAAISLWPAALAALGNLGVEEEVRAVGWPAPSLRVRGPSGRTLVDISPEQLRSALGGEGLVVHRADLQRVLLDAMSNVPIQFGVACTNVRQVGEAVMVQTEAGDELRADAVVGCDGVRTAIGPAVPGQLSLRYQGVTTWRAVVDDTDLVAQRRERQANRCLPTEWVSLLLEPDASHGGGPQCNAQRPDSVPARRLLGLARSNT